MIYIQPVGGLGNMFFHIASIYSLAKDNNTELILLNMEEKIQHLKNDKRIDLKHASEYKFIFDRFNEYVGTKTKINYPFSYKDLVFVDNHEYVGYFQSENYFKHRRGEIKELFKPTEYIDSELGKYSHLFGNISLHVRRNDYVKLYSNVHVPQPIDYYNNALTLLPTDLKVIIFSDDLEWCKNNFIGDRYVFIDEIDYISLYLMTKMKYHIVANSTFSWWGAWLSDSEKVISPKMWFGDNTPSSHIIPNNWIKI